MNKGYDVIVIGGGIMGTSAAFQLVERGLRVALIEKGLIGDGPTGQSSAILRTHYSNELTSRMAQFGLEFFRDFREHTGDECGFHETGFLMLGPASNRAGIEHNVALQQRLGIASEMLGPAEVAEIMPGLDLDASMVAAWEPHSGFADPYLAVTILGKVVRERGADVFQETAVTDIRRDQGKVAGVDTSEGSFDAPWVVSATGAWAGAMAQKVGIDAPISSCRVQVAHYQRPAGGPETHPIVADLRAEVYFRPEVGEKTLVGLIDQTEAEAKVDPDDYPRKPDFSFLAETGEKVSRSYPRMAEAASSGGYASLYAITPDWHPIVDQVPEGSGHILCSGFSGHGFKLGPAVGVMVAEMITGAAEPRFDPQLFRLDRYAEKKRVSGEYGLGIYG